MTPLAAAALAASSVLAFLACLFVLRLVGAPRPRLKTGAEALLGEVGEVTDRIDTFGGGRLRVHGELWQAWSHETLAQGVRARVVAVRGLVLEVTAENLAAFVKARP